MSSQLQNDLNILHTIRDYIRWSASRFVSEGLFFGHGTDNALDEANALIMHALHLPYDLPERYLDAVLTFKEREQIAAIVGRRIKEKIPAAYLTQEAIFSGLSFYVDDRVLVPRSPIAEMIEQHFNPWVDPEHVFNILDLCTGSACIAIACAYAFPEAKIDAIDISEDALQVAEINKKRHQLGAQLELIQSDLFDHLNNQSYDIIVSNPPYVSQAELEQLPAEYHAEPYKGFAGGETGLDLVNQILAQAGKYLNESGILVMEVGSSAETLQGAFPDIPFYWIDFERGGDGVFLLTAEQLNQYQPLFSAAILRISE